MLLPLSLASVKSRLVLVPAHPGNPGQSSESCKTGVCNCMYVEKASLNCLTYSTVTIPQFFVVFFPAGFLGSFSTLVLHIFPHFGYWLFTINWSTVTFANECINSGERHCADICELWFSNAGGKWRLQWDYEGWMYYMGS